VSALIVCGLSILLAIGMLWHATKRKAWTFVVMWAVIGNVWAAALTILGALETLK
jgi:hypothetical protein